MKRIWLLTPILFLLVNCQETPYKQGKILYENFCANCHMEDGSGLKGLIPPLAGADYLEQNQEQLACIIRYGLADTIEVNGKQYSQEMAGIPQLSAFEIANVINYINHAWGNDYGYVPIGEVNTALESCE